MGGFFFGGGFFFLVFFFFFFLNLQQHKAFGFGAQNDDSFEHYFFFPTQDIHTVTFRAG